MIRCELCHKRLGAFKFHELPNVSIKIGVDCDPDNPELCDLPLDEAELTPQQKAAATRAANRAAANRAAAEAQEDADSDKDDAQDSLQTPE